jgi:hypothetical protein
MAPGPNQRRNMNKPLTPEQQRIAIAKASGWKYHNDGDYVWLLRPDGSKSCGHGDRSHKQYWQSDSVFLPDYLNDLNAMHEVEMRMFESYDTLEGAELLSRYTKYLVRLEHPLFANASQRAEAYILANNLLHTSQEPMSKPPKKSPLDRLMNLKPTIVRAKEDRFDRIPTSRVCNERLIGENLAKHIADVLFNTPTNSDDPCQRIAFKGGKYPSAETDLGGLCKSALANVILKALQEYPGNLTSI